MRIGVNLPDPQQISSKPSSPASAGPQNAAFGEDGDAFAGDTVSLCTLASRALQSPEVRQNKVSELQQQIDSGTYQLNPQSIADSMLN